MNTIISFGLCPFVQRSLITMNYKNIPFEVKYIDLANKPDWFLEISPLGKVPVLKVENEILFESAVINEYIDETNSPSLHHKDPLKKAIERAYIELAGVTTMNYFNAASATDKDSYSIHKTNFEKNLSSILTKYKGPFFRGNEFSLVDSSVIPLIQRLMLTGNFREDLVLSDENSAKLNSWLESTLSMDAVQNSVPENFEQDYKTYLTNKNSYIHTK